MQNDISQFRQIFDAGDHWILIASLRDMAFLRRILDRSGSGADDFIEALAIRDRRLFIVLAISKRTLSALHLRRHLRSIGIRLSKSQMREKDVLIIVPDEMMGTATALAGAIFDDPDAPKAGKPPYTVQARHCSLN